MSRHGLNSRPSGREARQMTTMFIGGSLGSWAAAHAYERWAGRARAGPPPPSLPSGCSAGSPSRHKRRKDHI
jgi:hypothetical protein